MYIYLTLALHFFLHDALPISFSIIFQVEPAKSFILKFLTFRSPQETLDVHSVFANACLFVDSILPSNAFGFLAGCSPPRYSRSPRCSQLLSLLRMVVRSHRPRPFRGHSPRHRAGFALGQKSANRRDKFGRESRRPAHGSRAGNSRIFLGTRTPHRGKCLARWQSRRLAADHLES